MKEWACLDKVKFTMAKVDGQLRFTSFSVEDGVCCQETLDMLMRYLLSRPLIELDLGKIRRIPCPLESLSCLQSVVRAIKDYQALFCETTESVHHEQVNSDP